MTVDLAAFVLARVEDDEAVARAVLVNDWTRIGEAVWTTSVDVGDEHNIAVVEPDVARCPPTYWGGNEISAHIARFDPARVLADCEAKRRTVEHCVEVLDLVPAYDDTLDLAHDTLRYLAAVYSDHPDYRAEWTL